MFERFTGEARRAVVLAQEEARQMCHAYIGTEHLLLALLNEGHGPAAQALLDHGLTGTGLRAAVIGYIEGQENGLDPDALAAIGIDLDQVRQVTEASFGPGALEPTKKRRAMPKGHIPFSKRAKKVLELSLRESLRLGHKYIGSGHVLLGLIREADGLAVRVLVEAGVDLEELREDVTRRIRSEAA